MISVILTVYGRPENLDLQLEYIKKQTVKPDEIIIVVDKNPSKPFDSSKYSEHQIIEFSKNIGVWARFSIALLAKNKYVCVFDDDTIPGERWFENCIDTLKTVDGLLGTVGVKFKSGSADYDYEDRVGWPNPNKETQKVDIVGHSWFFKREILESFWKNTQYHHLFKKSGEDMHFSYIIKKELNINTFVPPHPNDDTTLWGSLPEYAQKLGSDSNALSLETLSNLRMSKYLNKIRKDGFVFQSEIESEGQNNVPKKLNKIKFYTNNILFILKSLIKKIIKF